MIESLKPAGACNSGTQACNPMRRFPMLRPEKPSATRTYQRATQNPYGGANSPTPNTINRSNDFAMKRCKTVALGKTRAGAWSCSCARMPPVSGTNPAPHGQGRDCNRKRQGEQIVECHCVGDHGCVQ